MVSVSLKTVVRLFFLPICLFADQYFIWLKRRADFILNCLIDIIKSVHFAIVD